MGRTSKDLDKKLILIGQAMIQDAGVTGLSLREVARKANVNLGMLNYYFDGKDDFVLKCLADLYNPFLEELKQVKIAGDSEKNFEDFLFKLAVFSRDNRKLIIILLKDMISQDEVVAGFISKNFSDHFQLIQASVIHFLKMEKAEQAKKELAFRYVLSLIGLHNLIVGFKEMIQGKSATNDSDEELLQRVKLTIATLKQL